MNLLFDTNIIINIVRSVDITGITQFLNPANLSTYISVVSQGEVKSIALQNNWGVNRLNFLAEILDQSTIIDINKLSLTGYSEIDAYSQLLNPGFQTYPFDTPKNMGKSDLWIASLAALLGLQLVTTDSDFDHLHNVFFDVRKVSKQEFLPFFKK